MIVIDVLALLTAPGRRRSSPEIDELVQIASALCDTCDGDRLKAKKKLVNVSAHTRYRYTIAWTS